MDNVLSNCCYVWLGSQEYTLLHPPSQLDSMLHWAEGHPDGSKKHGVNKVLVLLSLVARSSSWSQITPCYCPVLLLFVAVIKAKAKIIDRMMHCEHQWTCPLWYRSDDIMSMPAVGITFAWLTESVFLSNSFRRSSYLGALCNMKQNYSIHMQTGWYINRRMKGNRHPMLHGIGGFCSTYALPYGLVVRISGFHPDGPGSIPGVGTSLFSTLSSARQNFSLSGKGNFEVFLFVLPLPTILCLRNSVCVCVGGGGGCLGML